MSEDVPATSRQSRCYDVPKSIYLRLDDATPRARLDAFRVLTMSLGAALPMDAAVTVDQGLISIAAESSDRMFTVEYAIVFPIADLDEPEANVVLLSGRVVRLPASGGVIFAHLARETAHEALLVALESLVAAGQPLARRVAVLRTNPLANA